MTTAPATDPKLEYWERAAAEKLARLEEIEQRGWASPRAFPGILRRIALARRRGVLNLPDQRTLRKRIAAIRPACIARWQEREQARHEAHRKERRVTTDITVLHSSADRIGREAQEAKDAPLAAFHARLAPDVGRLREAGATLAALYQEHAARVITIRDALRRPELDRVMGLDYKGNLAAARRLAEGLVGIFDNNGDAIAKLLASLRHLDRGVLANAGESEKRLREKIAAHIATIETVPRDVLALYVLTYGEVQAQQMVPELWKQVYSERPPQPEQVGLIARASGAIDTTPGTRWGESPPKRPPVQVVSRSLGGAA